MSIEQTEKNYCCFGYNSEIEPSFSWSSCECCSSGLGGDRYDITCREGDRTGEIVELEVCTDCFVDTSDSWNKASN